MPTGPNILPNTNGGAILTHYDNIYDLSCTREQGCKWTINMKKKLPVPRNYHVGITCPANAAVRC